MGRLPSCFLSGLWGGGRGNGSLHVSFLGSWVGWVGRGNGARLPFWAAFIFPFWAPGSDGAAVRFLLVDFTDQAYQIWCPEVPASKSMVSQKNRATLPPFQQKNLAALVPVYVKHLFVRRVSYTCKQFWIVYPELKSRSTARPSHQDACGVGPQLAFAHQHFASTVLANVTLFASEKTSCGCSAAVWQQS